MLFSIVFPHFIWPAITFSHRAIPLVVSTASVQVPRDLLARPARPTRPKMKTTIIFGRVPAHGMCVANSILGSGFKLRRNPHVQGNRTKRRTDGVNRLAEPPLMATLQAQEFLQMCVRSTKSLLQSAGLQVCATVPRTNISKEGTAPLFSRHRRRLLQKKDLARP